MEWEVTILDLEIKYLTWVHATNTTQNTKRSDLH